MYFCKTCGERVRPLTEPGIVAAVELLPGRGFGNPNDVIEGKYVYFHEDHYPLGKAAERYRRKPIPTAIDDGPD
jgi:hypothetical protein